MWPFFLSKGIFGNNQHNQHTATRDGVTIVTVIGHLVLAAKARGSL
jgi:hypothetical protein